MRRIPLGHLSYLVPVSRISLSLSQVGRLSWSHIQGNSGDFPMQSSGFAPISRLFPAFPNTLSFPFAPSKVYDLFPLRLSGPASFLATKPGGGAGGVSEATPRMLVLQWGRRGNGSSCGSQLNQPSHPEPILSPWSLQKLSAAAGGRGGPSTPVTPPRLPPVGALSGHPYTSLRPAILLTYPQCSGVRGAPGWPEKGRG